MQAQAWAGWNTPRATDGSHGGPNQAGGALSADAAMTGWPTPAANTYGEDLEREMARRARLKEKHGNGNGAGMTIALAAQITTDAEMCEAMGYPVTPHGPAR
jgi:hypothetical protein